jgi:hypothetical protein
MTVMNTFTQAQMQQLTGRLCNANSYPTQVDHWHHVETVDRSPSLWCTYSTFVILICAFAAHLLTYCVVL